MGIDGTSASALARRDSELRRAELRQEVNATIALRAETRKLLERSRKQSQALKREAAGRHERDGEPQRPMRDSG